jgi:hypothetical protein
VKSRATHIEVRAHLDLTGWSSTFSASHPGGSSAFEIPIEVQSIRVRVSSAQSRSPANSICLQQVMLFEPFEKYRQPIVQGNCSKPYPAPSSFETETFDTVFLPKKASQCLLLFSCTVREKYCPWFHFFITDPNRSQLDGGNYRASPLWFDSISIRALGGGGSSIVTYRDLWMTNVTMHWSNPHTSMWPGPLWAVGDVHIEGECWSPNLQILQYPTSTCHCFRGPKLTASTPVTEKPYAFFTSAPANVLCQ